MKPKPKLTNVNARIAGTTRAMYHGKTPDQVGEHIAEVAVKAFTTFGEHVREIGKEYDWLREYFRHKPKDERVCGCLTWKEYCESVLGKSYQAMYYALNPEKRSKAKPKALPPAPPPLGSASYVKPSHPDYAKIAAGGLINDEANCGVEEGDVPEQAAEKIVMKRRDGTVIPEATYAVQDAVRHSVAFVQSTYQFMSAAEKAQVIDKVIEKLQSERDFILRETTIVVLDEAGERSLTETGATVNTVSELTVNPEPHTDPEPPLPQPPKRKKSHAAPSAKIPTFGYPGGKARLAKRIAGMLPTSGTRFVEPFAGRGNVYFYVAAHGMYPSHWLNDIQTAPFLFSLRIGHILSVPENTKENLVKFRALARSKAGFRDGRFISPLQINRAFLSEPYLCWNGGKYGQSGGTRRGTQAGYSEKIRMASEILRGTDTKITRLDYRDVLARCGPDDVVYLDPPYVDANVKAYTDKTLDHREMVEILKNAKFKWVLSEYEQPLYIEAFGEPALRIPVKRGMGKSGGGSKGSKLTVECLWTNFALEMCDTEQKAA